ncbi:PHP domain-containing protein [Marinobacter confluentis]|uniref:PHP domain-containing protein n=1 Tax=Marinobacter confluentis TaxID=1697557 RepID=A0A4Z1CJ26_9GAMM|nr:PHP domain-containing protein [Marinobacter confluentis]TGN41312.1 PHP domain-containing protein [Marinobacter confluentis]
MTIPQEASFCIDLHCHSTASDGALSPEDLITRASEKGVTHLALTDHDTVAGLTRAASSAAGAGISLISGTELSCVWRSQTIHVVGLDFDSDDPVFRAALDRQNDNRWGRARAITDKLSRLGVDDLLGKATLCANGDVPGRPHFARVLVDEGIVKDPAQAFKRHLGAGKPGDVKAFWPELEEVVQWIVDAGGVAVLAHPRKYRLTATRLRALVADFKRAGGRSIEVSTSGQSSGDLGFLAELCRREELLGSQGSDFHFPGAPWCELGRITKMPDGIEPVWHHFRTPVGQAGA